MSSIFVGILIISCVFILVVVWGFSKELFGFVYYIYYMFY